MKADGSEPDTNRQPVRQCACAILCRDGRVLLGRRSRSARTYPGCWDVVGGHVEPGESVEAALVREVREEVGVTATTYEWLGTLSEPDPEVNGAAAYHFYGVTARDGGEPEMLGTEHSELRWFPVDEACRLPALEIPACGPFFRKAALNGADSASTDSRSVARHRTEGRGAEE